MNGKIITPHQIFDPGYLTMENDIITGVSFGRPEMLKDLVIDLHGKYVSPGFIDLHLHGGGGYDTMDGTAEAISAIAEVHARGGTTSFLPTTLTSSTADLYRAIDACVESQNKKPHGARILGVHLEGPYFAPTQAGAQDPRYLKNPDSEEYRAILDYPLLLKEFPRLPNCREETN